MKLYLVTYADEQEVVYVVSNSMAQIEAEWKREPIDEIKFIDDEIIVLNNLKSI